MRVIHLMANSEGWFCGSSVTNWSINQVIYFCGNWCSCHDIRFFLSNPGSKFTNCVVLTDGSFPQHAAVMDFLFSNFPGRVIIFFVLLIGIFIFCFYLEKRNKKRKNFNRNYYYTMFHIIFSCLCHSKYKLKIEYFIIIIYLINYVACSRIGSQLGQYNAIFWSRDYKLFN